MCTASSLLLWDLGQGCSIILKGTVIKSSSWLITANGANWRNGRQGDKLQECLRNFLFQNFYKELIRAWWLEPIFVIYIDFSFSLATSLHLWSPSVQVTKVPQYCHTLYFKTYCIGQSSSNFLIHYLAFTLPLGFFFLISLLKLLC